jgi:hypothetical protein
VCEFRGGPGANQIHRSPLMYEPDSFFDLGAHMREFYEPAG